MNSKERGDASVALTVIVALVIVGFIVLTVIAGVMGLVNNLGGIGRSDDTPTTTEPVETDGPTTRTENPSEESTTEQETDEDDGILDDLFPDEDATDEGTSPTEPGSDEAVDASVYRDMLDRLPLSDPDAEREYDRDAFGEAWEDVDGNGCDTRNDILQRDLVEFTLDGDDCTVIDGTLEGPYTGTVIEFVRGQGTSSDVQIDHIVPLANAWYSGADEWTEEQRVEFANDPENLVAVDGPTNSSKGASTIDEWVTPDDMYWCTYTQDIIEVKDAWGLSVTIEEYDELVWMLENACAPGWTGYEG